MKIPPLHKFGYLILGTLTIGFLGLVLLQFYVNSSTKQSRRLDLTEVDKTKVGIVFGAGVYADGTPTHMLADRLETAIELYRQHKIHKILMSGDNSSQDYDEVTNMQRYVTDRGIPKSDITLDYAGFSTYETCYRARSIFGIEAAVLITQSFHLPRAVYICSNLGIASQGIGTPDRLLYPRSELNYQNMRELASNVKALWEVHVTKPSPTFLGKFEGMN